MLLLSVFSFILLLPLLLGIGHWVLEPPLSGKLLKGFRSELWAFIQP